MRARMWEAARGQTGVDWGERERKGTKSKRMGGCVYVCVRSAVNAEMQETREKYGCMHTQNILRYVNNIIS